MTEQRSGSFADKTPQTERRIRCSCGFRSGWFDPDDANHIASHHAGNCDGEVEYQEREKDGINYSDKRIGDEYLLTLCPHCDDGKDYECSYCGKGFRLPGPRSNHELVCMGP